MLVYAATSNRGKLAELEAIFAGSGLELRTSPAYVSPDEGETAYADNAALKAQALYELMRRAGPPAAVLADDSGLEVDALGGRPGVLTALYGGSGATWPERRRRLLDELAATGGARGARFVCALHFIDAGGRVATGWGTVEGTIAYADRGAAGFSFDPIFVYPPAGKTFAELDEREKNRVSHRAQAAAALLRALRGTPPLEAERTSGPGRSSAW